jgi:ubiquitin C-terminal hydrolase
MDLIKYNSDYAFSGNGFENLGNSCYFNSLLQCILSCTSLFEALDRIKNTEQFKKNKVAQILLFAFNMSSSEKDITRLCRPLYNMIINYSRSRRDNNAMQFFSQEDSHEGFMLLMEILEPIHSVRKLFEHRYKTEIYCVNCKKIVLTKKQENNIITIHPDQFNEKDAINGKQDNFNTFLLKQIDRIDNDYICPNCKGKGGKTQATTLTMIPEILPIVIKKYTEKKDIKFPNMLFFNCKNKKKMIYKLVAQNEHMGNMHGGHYTAFGLRKSGWYFFNDESYMTSRPIPTINTYMLFYHFFGYT